MTTDPFDHLHSDLTGFMHSSILGALAELDFGTAILQNNNSLTAAELAQQRACDKRGTQTLLDALVALGYFAKSGAGAAARYSVIEKYKTYLDSRHPATFIPMMRHMACVQRKWAQLAWSVQNGTPQKNIPSILGAEQDSVSFIMAMNSIAINLVENTMNLLFNAGILSSSGSNLRILDIGGASGTYTEAFLKKLPDSSAALFDLPVAIAQAQKRFKGTDLESRVSLVAGDFTKDALPPGFDFAWVSAIIHQMNRDKSRMLYAKALDALKPGGMVAVRDYVMREDRAYPVDGALFGINMLVSTQDGMVYTYKEIEEDLELAGFTQVNHAIDVPTMSAVVTAKKPN